MIEIFEIFWSSPIELRVIILGVLIIFPLLTYLRGQVVALYKLMVNIQSAIKKLEEQIKEEEKRKDSK